MLTGTTVWVVFVVYSLFILGIGLYAWKTEEAADSKNYYTGQGSISSLVLIMTYLASLMSTWVFFAGPGGYYRGGLTFWMSELSYIPLFPLITYFVMTKVWLLNSERSYVTPADVYCDRFPSKILRLVLSIVFLISSLPYVASVLVAGAKAAVTASGGSISYNMVILIMGITMLIYVVLGGMRSVAWTDTVQGWIFIILLWMIAGSTLMIGTGGSITTAVSKVWQHTNEWFSYPGPHHWVPYKARLGYPLSCAIGWTIMLPHVFVRSGLASKDLSSQRKLMKAVPILQTVVWTGTMFIGFLGVSLMPGLPTEKTELIIPFLIDKIVSPVGPQLAYVLMIGFFIGAVAVGMSTANSFLLVSGSIISEDIIQKIFGVELSEKKKMITGRLVIVALGIGSMLLAMNPPNLIWTLIMFAIAIVMPLFPILVAALYWKRATTPAAIISTIAGTITVLLTYFQWNLGNTWYGAIGMLVSTVLIIVVSYLTAETDDKVVDSFYGAMKTAESKLYVD